MNSLSMTKLEENVLQWLLAGDEPIMANLRLQLEKVVEIQREYTGVGFYLNFKTPPDINRLTEYFDIKSDFSFGDVEANIEGLNNGAGFLLWIKNGIIDSLEGYTFDEEWLLEIHDFQLRYIGNGTRNWDELKKNWGKSASKRTGDFRV